MSQSSLVRARPLGRSVRGKPLSCPQCQAQLCRGHRNPGRASLRRAPSAAFAAVPNTQFSTFDSRLKSFWQWPHSAAIRPLATPSASFFFLCLKCMPAWAHVLTNAQTHVLRV